MNNFTARYGPWAMVAGASEGLGAAFAGELAKRGLNLILLARRMEKLEELSTSLRGGYKVEITCHSQDLADFAQTRLLISGLREDVGLLVYNAAFSPIGNFTDIPENDLDRIVDVNVRTPMLLSRLISKQMIERGKGGIVLMSSLAGTQGSPRIATYAASKAFNTVLAEGIWHELREHGIDVLASCAGAITTPGYQNAQNAGHAPGTLDPDQVAKRTLNALGKGPVTVPGFTNIMARFLMSRVLPRKLAISIMAKNTKNLT